MESPILTTMPKALLFPSATKEYTVTEISKDLQGLIEREYRQVKIKGELSGVKLHTSGHLYYTIKDQDAVLDGVCWRGSVSKLSIQPKDGMEVVITGKISTFAARSKYLVVAEQIEESGLGVLQKKFQELKDRLEKEGLFDESHKKRIPKIPKVILLVTSPTGAVVQDLAHRLKERYTEKVYLYPTLVQGDVASDKIAKILREAEYMNPKPDVIILARGGGSIEDLWAFNEEMLIRAIYESTIPIISAVGHETDVTLCDYVSDLRMPTPSAAGENVAPKKIDIEIYLKNQSLRLLTAFNNKLEILKERMKRIRLSDVLKSQQQKVLKLDDFSNRLYRNMQLMFHVKHQIVFNKTLTSSSLVNRLENSEKLLALKSQQLKSNLSYFFESKQRRFQNVQNLLEAYSFKKTLDRGFAVVRSEDGKVLSTIKDVLEKKHVRVILKDGEVLLKN